MMQQNNMQYLQKESVSISTLADDLKQGKTIIYPTETCYGLGADATNDAAVSAIFDIKKRDPSKALLVLLPSFQSVLEYVEWSPILETLAKRYWPGPLTCVMKVKEGTGLSKHALAADGTLAFRVSSHPFCLALSEALGAPLISTSANISSMPSCYDEECLRNMFDTSTHQPDLVVLDGALPEQLPSTIVKIDGNILSILRQGEIIINTAEFSS